MHFNQSHERKKVKIAIIGARIAGCSSAYFLEEIFGEQFEKQLEIDIYERENAVNGEGENIFNYNGLEYDLSPLNYVNYSEFYMRNFAEMSGNYPFVDASLI